MWAGFWYGFCTGAIVILLCWIKSLSPRGFRAALRGWQDRHEVRVPEPCSLDEAFDGEREPQRRELHALERDVLCRVLSDLLYQLQLHRNLDALTFDPGPGGVRLDAWEVPLLQNVWEAINPRDENNW